MSQPAAPLLSIEQLKFDNQSIAKLPIDPETRNFVPNACFSRVAPTPVENPRLVAWSREALSLVGVDEADVEHERSVAYLGGNLPIPGAEPAAHTYCGIQFGNFAGQLGDGATMYLGEVLNSRGERWEIQFKGAGLTPYSRTADGRKVLRSSLREFVCSEAMHWLGVPTTRAGSLVTSDTRIERDPHYNGRRVMERASIITRIAPTFIRLGSFEVAKPMDPRTGRSGPSSGLADKGRGIVKVSVVGEALTPVAALTQSGQSLAMHVLSYYPNLPKTRAAAQSAGLVVAEPADGSVTEDEAAAVGSLYREVVVRTARLVAAWQAVGWCHGVLNTDNVSVVGVTIDYGPFGFLDRYDPDHICNGSDDSGRYRYRNQPAVCRWDLERFADMLALLAHGPTLKRDVLPEFALEYRRETLRRLRRKLGLVRFRLPEDGPLAAALLDTMAATGADFTNAWRTLALVPLPSVDQAAGWAGAPGQWVDAGPEAGAGAAVDPRLSAVLAAQCAPVEAMRAATRPRIPQSQLAMVLMLAQRNPMALTQLGIDPATLELEFERMEVHKRWAETTSEAKQAADRERWAHWLGWYAVRLAREVAWGATEAETHCGAARAAAPGEVRARDKRGVLPGADAGAHVPLLADEEDWVLGEDGLGGFYDAAEEADIHETGVQGEVASRIGRPPRDWPLSPATAESPSAAGPLRDAAAWMALSEQRVRVLLSSNPKFVFRNHVAEEVIQRAEELEFAPTRQLLDRLRDPFWLSDVDAALQAHAGYVGAPGAATGSAPIHLDLSGTAACGGAGGPANCPVAAAPRILSELPPAWATDLVVTCSS